MMLLLYETYLLLFVGRDKPPGTWLKCEQVLKISGCLAGNIGFEKSCP